jgi:dTDP-4-amino-4,6-dideoxygalactose transaminase
MTTHSFIPYARQSISAEDIQEVSKALGSAYITRGPYVEDFERAVAQYCGVKHAVAINSGTSALIAACHVADVGPNDRFLTTPNTFAGSVTAGMLRNATPIFVDIDPNTGNFDLDQVEANLKEYKSSRGRTIILPVHFGGIPVDMQKLDSIIRSPDTIVIEDAAHAIGSHYLDGQMVGCCAWSNMTIFSFHPAKTITSGEGGMILTNDDELERRLRRFRNNGIERDPAHWEDPSIAYEGYYEVKEMTNNLNFTELQAALGLSQLKRIDQFIEKRRALMAKYRQMFEGVQHIKLFTSEYDHLTAFHLCVAQIDFTEYNTNRTYVMAELRERGIGTQMHYIPVYRHPFFKNKCGDISPYFPKMEKYFSQALTLPLFFDMSLSDVEYVVQTLKDILSEEYQKKRLVKNNKKFAKEPRKR